MTDVLSATPEGISRAVELLTAGKVVAFPTDTVYGIGVALSRRERLDDLFALKARPADRRIPILVSDLAQAIGAGWEADERAHRLTERFWPGALTLVLAGSGETQAFRVPDHPVVLQLIRAAGPILSTSANRSGEPETLGADDVLIAFALQQDGLAAVVDGGTAPGGVASTVLDLSVTPARILREGPVTRAQLENLIELAR
ncbi:MAG: threonylcarbamoyl-AMP synthase [Chloroflexi bacterium]|nr:threonylcarbamoyl-AMP synthase [Chloroflexota bacterium]MBA3739548.1 threonylcarbamoyl-AMP synthase [Chloroflexota bacterium]